MRIQGNVVEHRTVSPVHVSLSAAHMHTFSYIARSAIGALLTALLLSPSAPLAAQQSEADQAISRAVAAYSSVRTARATFEQRIVNSLTGSRLNSRGEFEQSRPDKFAFRFSDPKGDMIISDGKFVWAFLPSSVPDQVIRTPLTKDMSGSFDLIGAFFTNPTARYVIRDAGAETIGEYATRAVSLIPKEGVSANFSRAKVWIDIESGLLRQFESVEHNGITRVVRITSFTRNATVAASAFRFKVPRGVKVVDGSGM